MFTNFARSFLSRKSTYVTGFAKRGLPHTSNIASLMIYNFVLYVLAISHFHTMFLYVSAYR